MEKQKLVDGADESDFSGTHMNLGVMLDPIPLIPVGFGLGINMPNISGKDKDGNKFEMTGMSFDLFIKAWSPIGLFGITPYVKAGLTAFGGYKTSTKVLDTSVDLPYTNSGTNIAVGFLIL